MPGFSTGFPGVVKIVGVWVFRWVGQVKLGSPSQVSHSPNTVGFTTTTIKGANYSSAKEKVVSNNDRGRYFGSSFY